MTEAGPQVAGWRCRDCGYPIALAAPWCPRCRGTLTPDAFGPYGTVWSSTVFRVALGERTPPWTLAYVDLDDGPRILVHVEGTDRRLRVGARVEMVGESTDGDLVAKEWQE
jgi:uncharacterized OB-fold protein